jgi:hypothetical protein
MHRDPGCYVLHLFLQIFSVVLHDNCCVYYNDIHVQPLMILAGQLVQ